MEIYLDINDNEIPKKAWDKHHVIPKSTWKGNDREWAKLSGLEVPMVKTFHNLGKTALHSNVPHPPRPTREIQSVIRYRLYATASPNPYDRFLAVTDAVHHLAEVTEDDHTSWLAGRIAVNLELQAPYILEGQVKIIETED
jgi:hypothetical protein